MTRPTISTSARQARAAHKKVLLIIIDALASRVVNPALEAGRLPNLRRLRDAATLQDDSIAIFPSITPAATSSLITGCYPRDHGISGAYWYIPQEKRVVYFGYDFWAILDEGLEDFFKDFIVKLNEEHLDAQTVYQRVEEQGLTAGSLNYLIYHGNQMHDLKLLPLRRLMPDFLRNLMPDGPTHTTVGGPTLLYFGALVHTELASGEELSHPNGPFERFGFSDNSTATLLLQLVERDALPDFTVAYFPDNDFRSHEVGPEAAVENLEDLDEQLGEVFAAAGGLEKMLTDHCIVVTGDHSQSDVVDDQEAASIRLDELLADYSVADAGTPMDDENDLVICPNLRTAQLYFHTPTPQRVNHVVEQLNQDGRIDQIMWCADLVNGAHDGFHVKTEDRGDLHFWPGDDGPEHATDRHGTAWSWKGDLRAVDGHVADGVITFGDYPNAFERIAGILELGRSGHLWVTSRPGYEFALEHTQIHAGGGSHGSLHRLDSVSPLWVAGAPTGVSLPAAPRSVDVAPLCLEILGLKWDGG